MILVKPLYSATASLISHPLGYELMWNDKGSSGDMDGSFWQVTPKQGYVALGDVVTNNYSQPSTLFSAKFACIDERLVVRGTLDSNVLWTDKGSGADRNGSVWQVDGPGLAGFIKVQKGYEKPTIPVYALPTKVVQKRGQY